MNKAVERSPENFLSLGNQGLVLFLLGEEGQAAAAYLKAFELGDEDFYKATLTDVEASPPVKAEAFKALVTRVWGEVDGET